MMLSKDDIMLVLKKLRHITHMKEPFKFAANKALITQRIQEKLRENGIVDPAGFSLVDGFIMQPLSAEVSGNLTLGGPTLPLVAVVANTSGRVYYFAAKALLPSELELG
jgi:hypothetical protein